MKKSYYIIGGVALTIGLVYLFFPDMWGGGNNYTKLRDKFKRKGTHTVMTGKNVEWVSNTIPVIKQTPIDMSKGLQPIKITK